MILSESVMKGNHGSLFALGKEFFRKGRVKAAGTVIELDGLWYLD